MLLLAVGVGATAGADWAAAGAAGAKVGAAGAVAGVAACLPSMESWTLASSWLSGAASISLVKSSSRELTLTLSSMADLMGEIP